MKFNFINNLEDVSFGDNFYKDENGEVKILCYQNFFEITDFKNLKYYSKNILKENGVTIFRNFLEDKENVKSVKSLIEALEKDNSIQSFKIEKNRVFNPFIKEINGKLQIKVKNDRLTKNQIRKILTHKDTKVKIFEKYSDDYAYDNAMNFFKGIEMTRLEALYDVFNFFDHCYKNKDNSISLVVNGNSKYIDVVNKNIEFI